ncbi:uncharacterized protein LOC143465971 [Clavelina lepadiformis]|uniref:Uncharacterized protein n=1 Tax=Clavelina lepadiformis TaxID=159417 RepID=A0ABP0EUH5_CLALP
METRTADDSDVERTGEDRPKERRHSHFSKIPLARRMQEGAWGKFQERGRRSLERLENRVSSRFMGRPVNLYIAILAVFLAIIITVVYVEVFLKPQWKDAEEQLRENLSTTAATDD